MRGTTLLVCGSLACGSMVCGASGYASAQTAAGDLLERVTRKVLDTVDRLPKYMCTQTIDRQQYDPVSAHVESSCEPARHKQTRLSTSDRLRLDVAVSASHEMYSWVGESRFADRSLFDLVGSGAISTGSFSAFLTVVFRTDNTAFSYKGAVTEGGRTLEEFEFRVPKAMSHYFYGGAGARVVTGYYGSILVDRATADLVRLEVHTEGLPPETGSCRSSSTLDYTRLRLNGADFLLPQRAQLYILNEGGVELKNSTVFSGCHEFLGESTLHFEEAPEPGTEAAKGSAAAGDLPAGLPFEIALSKSIDPASAAAGDKVAARLTGPIRDANRQTLVPKGAAVTARILQIRRYHGPTPVVRMILKLETVEIAGTARPLAAGPDTTPLAPPVAVRGSLQRRSDPVTRVMLDNQDAQAAVFQFSNIGGNFVVPSGQESKWWTGKR